MHSSKLSQYLSIAAPAEALFKDKGSKFFAFVFPFEDEKELKKILENLRKEHHNARHFCFAYRIHPKEIKERANDDGEPAHTAGTPILGQLQSKQLVDVLLVVVRYFGGTKLGVPGLINAYKTASKLALENAVLVEKEIEEEVKIAFDYAEMNSVMRILKKQDPRILSQNMLARAEMTLKIREDKVELLKAQLKLVKSLIFMA